MERGGRHETYPRVKQMEKAIPTRARDLLRVVAVVTSLMMALQGVRRLRDFRAPGETCRAYVDSCTLPSLNPPTSRERR